MQYQYTAEDIDNYVIIDMQSYDIGVEAARKANLEFVVNNIKLFGALYGGAVAIVFDIIDLKYCIYELQHKDGSTIDVITSGGGLFIDIAYEITKSKRLGLISNVLTVTSYINGRNDMYADINSLTHMKNKQICPYCGMAITSLESRFKLDKFYEKNRARR